MPCLQCRAPARRIIAVAVVFAVIAHTPDLAAADPAAAPPLDLATAERQALTDQPRLEALRAQVRAARERAVSAAQLPDPKLIAGVTNLPANGEDRFSLSRDFMTMTGVGLAQEFPRAGKRRLRGHAQDLAAQTAEARLDAQERAIRRDAALGWLDAWLPQRAAGLVDEMVAEALRERGAAEIAFRSGRAPQADLLAAEVELELLQDRRRKLDQDADEARERLARWTGAPVGALAAGVPSLPAPPELPILQAAVDRHPELLAAQADVAERENALALAREEYKPDWRAELMYAWRPDFSEMATLQVGIDLPVFTRDRQGRGAAAAAEEIVSATATRDDRARALHAEAAAVWRAWDQAVVRLRRYDDVIVPAATARARAAPRWT